MLASIITAASGAAVMLFGKSVKHPPAEYTSLNSIHDIEVADIQGNTISLGQYAGKKFLLLMLQAGVVIQGSTKSYKNCTIDMETKLRSLQFLAMILEVKSQDRLQKFLSSAN